MQICEDCQSAATCTRPTDQYITYCSSFEPYPSVDTTTPIKTQKKPKLKSCPLCGNSYPTYTPFENNKGYWVSCSNPECGLWAHKLTDVEWNTRAFNKTDFTKFFYMVESVYMCSQKKEINEYVCVVCNKRGKRPSKVQHKKNCMAKKIMDILS